MSSLYPNIMPFDVGQCDCHALERELAQWRTAALVLIGILALIVGVNLFLTARRRVILMNHIGLHGAGIGGLGAGAESDKPWYASMADGDEGDFSDSISDTSSLFSPPFRADQGVVFKSAAADVSHTRSYIAPSVSTEKGLWTNLCVLLYRSLDHDSPPSHRSRLMNVCHQTPLTDDEVGVLFRWLDPKGLGAVLREDLQARLDGFLKQEEV